MEARTVDAKYIFLDIVGYSKNRTVEAQTEIISILNEIVKIAVQQLKISNSYNLFLPTGDGICIVLFNPRDPFDIHLNIALLILQLLNEHNNKTSDIMRKIKVRIGINENTDNLITDINNHKNIAGSGINMAQRIMGFGDESHILVSNIVYEKLSQRDMYHNKFASYNTTIKHNYSIYLYQYFDKSITYLNNYVPKSLSKVDHEEVKFSRRIAYYIGFLLKHSDFIKKYVGGGINNYILFIIIEFLANDAYEKHLSNEFTPFESSLPKTASGSLDELYQYFYNMNFRLLDNYRNMFFDYYINPYWGTKYFSYSSYLLEVSKDGIRKFFREWQEVADELELTKDDYIGV